MAIGIAAMTAISGLSGHPVVERFDGSGQPLLRATGPHHGTLAPDPASPENAAGVQIACVATADADAYVGIVRRAKIEAALGTVEEVLDDIPHYNVLFPGTVEVRINDRFDRRCTLHHGVGTARAGFFLPSVGYELSHLVDKSSPGQRVCRYKLRHSETPTASDGLVVLEATGKNATLLTEYGFFNARPNLLPTSTLWRQSARGAFVSTAAIKLKAENSTWSYSRVAAEAERLADRSAVRIGECVTERQARHLREDVDSFIDGSR